LTKSNHEGFCTYTFDAKYAAYIKGKTKIRTNKDHKNTSLNTRRVFDVPASIKFEVTAAIGAKTKKTLPPELSVDDIAQQESNSRLEDNQGESSPQ